MAYGTYGLQNQTFTWNGIPLQGVKSVNYSRPSERFTTTADNNTGDVTFVEMADWKLIEVTIATDQYSDSNLLLSALTEEGSTGLFAHYDNNGTTVKVIKGKFMWIDSGYTQDATDKNWKIVGRTNVNVEGGGL